MKIAPANLLTFYRIAAAPVAVVAVLLGWRNAFFLLLIGSLFSDLVDGPLARHLGQESARGAKLDTIADGSTVLAGLFGLYIFESDTLRPEAGWLLGFLVTYAGAAAACLIKFGQLPAYHLYLSKAGAVLSGLFVVWLYAFGYRHGLLAGVASIGMLANIESILATLLLRRFRTNIGSLLLVKRENGQRR